MQRELGEVQKHWSQCEAQAAEALRHNRSACLHAAPSALGTPYLSWGCPTFPASANQCLHVCLVQSCSRHHQANTTFLVTCIAPLSCERFAEAAYCQSLFKAHGVMHCIAHTPYVLVHLPTVAKLLRAVIFVPLLESGVLFSVWHCCLQQCA